MEHGDLAYCDECPNRDRANDQAPRAPADIGLERELLGCLMLYGDLPEDADAIRAAARALDHLDLHAGVHRAILAALLDLAEDNGPFSVIAVLGRLRARGTLSPPALPSIATDQASAADLAEVIQAAGFPNYLDYYRRTLRDLAGRRAAILLARDLLRVAHDEAPAAWCTQATARVVKLAAWLDGGDRSAVIPRPVPSRTPPQRG